MRGSAHSRKLSAPGGFRGEMMAWDPVQRRKAWTIPENFPLWSGAAATAGALVAVAAVGLWLCVVRAESGRKRPAGTSA